MAFIYNLYKDPECTIPVKSNNIGVLGIYDANFKNIQNWSRYNYHIDDFDLDQNKPEECIYFKYGFYQGTASVSPMSWFNIGRIYNGAELFQGKYLITDKRADNDNTQVPNAFFMSKRGNVSGSVWAEGSSSIFLQIYGSAYNAGTQDSNSIGVWLGQYVQLPRYGDNDRTNWNYKIGNYDARPEISFSQRNDSQYCNIGLFKITLPWGSGGTNANFVAVVCGYNDAGEFAAQFSDATKGSIMLFPEKLWQDAEVIPEPYVGPVSKESVETSFVPTRDRYRDSVEGRGTAFNTNTDLLDPYGLSQQYSEVKLLKQASAQYQMMVASIFHGLNDSFLGALVDFGFADEQFGTGTDTTHQRDRDEADLMSKGVLSCKLVPASLSADIATSTDWYNPTLCGYRWQGSAVNTGMVGGSICSRSIAYNRWPTFYPTRWFNSFLDYEPHTDITLYVPFCGTIKIDPSVLYNKGISIITYCDVITGLLSVDVVLTDTDGREYIYTTLQGNCGIDMPIIGVGSNAGQAITKIAGGIAGLVNGQNPVGNIFKTMEGLNGVDKSTPVGRYSNANMAPYFAPRQAFLMFCVPKPANPNKFITLYGGESNVSGPLSQFKGYLEVSAVDLGTTTATEAEKEEIIRLMKAGVFNGVYTNDGEVT